ncbi:zinc finger HIT domain-containing protein 2-like [Oscarella lobularis]|uniref:zinc finger HIT domain-containing protein 2-like n=1 Tax=Oscarella lobularis TaxID=121494 RepID=UPI0033132BF0
MASSDAQQCKMCKKQFGKYTCPRCHAPYCSLTCYKDEAHADCSETFYKEWFVQALKEKRGSSHEKRQMFDMLKRLDEDETESFEEESLEERLASLDIDSAEPEDIWKCLNESERRDFQHMISSGDVRRFISLYKPWWQEEKVSEDLRVRVPKLIDKMRPLKLLLGEREPAYQIKFNLINILYAYCYIVKLYNGDHKEISLEAANAVFDLSPVLRIGSNFNDVSTAAHVSVEKTNSVTYLRTSRGNAIATLCDVSLIVESAHVCAALSDLHDLLRLAEKETKREKGDKEMRKSLKLATKKIEFYISYCNEYCGDVRFVGAALQAIQESMTLETTEHEEDEKQVREALSQQKKQKRLIEEID